MSKGGGEKDVRESVLSFLTTLRAIDEQISTVKTTRVGAHASPSNGKKGIKKANVRKREQAT